MTALLKSVDRKLQVFLRWFCTAIFIVLALILLTNVAMRLMNDLSVWLDLKGFEEAGRAVKSLVPITSMHWFDEIVELCFAYLVFYGAASLWGLKGHFCVGDWISPRLPYPGMRALYKFIVTCLSLFFLGVFFWYSMRLTVRTTELSTVFQIPKAVMYSCMPIASFIMIAYSLVDVFLDVKEFFVPTDRTMLAAERDAKSM